MTTLKNIFVLQSPDFTETEESLVAIKAKICSTVSALEDEVQVTLIRDTGGRDVGGELVDMAQHTVDIPNEPSTVIVSIGNKAFEDIKYYKSVPELEDVTHAWVGILDDDDDEKDTNSSESDSDSSSSSEVFVNTVLGDENYSAESWPTIIFFSVSSWDEATKAERRGSELRTIKGDETGITGYADQALIDVVIKGNQAYTFTQSATKLAEKPYSAGFFTAENTRRMATSAAAGALSCAAGLATREWLNTYLVGATSQETIDVASINVGTIVFFAASIIGANLNQATDDKESHPSMTH